MKLYALFILLFSVICLQAQHNAQFSFMEINHIRVATPGLFSNGKKIDIRLDTLQNNQYAFPLPGAHVISGYSCKGRRHHSGADIKTHAKDTIVSAFDGIVRMAKPYGGYGEVIVVRHSNGMETIYSHNFKNFVASGDTVKAGQPIALTGRTGKATTEHLHFEVRINGQAVNPNLFFNLEKNEIKHTHLVCTKTGKGIQINKYTN